VSLTTARVGIRKAVAALFTSVAIEYENAPVTPAAGAKWIQIYSLDGRPRVDTLGDNGDNHVKSITQVTINYPIGTGSGASETDYETLQAHFPAGSSLIESTQGVTFENVDMSTGSIGSLWYKVHFSINWFAFIPR
jgi:hypothetical protein